MAASSPTEVAALSADLCDRSAEDHWHALSARDVLRRLAVRANDGLTGEQVEARRRAHGPNALPEPPPRPVWRLFARQFASPLIYILFAAALMAVALGHHGDAGVILAVVLANALIGTFQEGRAERSMAALRRLAAVQVRVLRNGRESMVEARHLVPGDIVLLAAGDAVGADARLLEESQLQAAEAALTGESVPVSKSAAPLPEATSLADRRNMVYSGTYLTAGRGIGVVVATGPHTEVGRIAGLTQNAAEPQTPLQERIGQFGRVLVAAAFALFVLVVLLGVWRELPLSEVLMVAISQMVSMVPEGLPVAMTIALAVGMQRMAARGVIIRRLSAVETLGSTTVICSDKTGTLTRNEMTVTALWLPPAGGQTARRIDVSGIGYRPQGELSEAGAPVDAQAPALASLLEAAVLCNDAQILPPRDGHNGWAVVGDPTEGALLVLAAKAGIDLEPLRELAPREAELPFDSDAKLMATRHRLHGAPRRVIVKGAPEAVLRLCAGAAPETLRTAREAADEMAAQALRVLAFAVVEDGTLDPVAGFDALIGRARLLGLAGQIDPPRDEAKAAVADCRAAGIRPVMVTGDHKLTGLAIARALGIARDGDRAVDGTELERMGEAELRDELPGIAVFARVRPAQKLRIVEALQARGEVVAMTGDGVNDAPALARADVGVAMGITGTEVAKSAARIVITDDNFATIVRAVEQGRVVYGNLKKVILYLFATSIDEVALLLLALLAGFPLPLAAVQILWINIVTEGTLTVNLVMQPADGDEMRRKPVPRDDPLVDRGMLRRVALMALVTVTVTFGWFVWRMGMDTDLAQARTETFTLLAMCQWFNVLNCQSPSRTALGTGLFRNRWLVVGLAASVILQLAVIYVPAMNTLFHTVALPVPVVLLLAGLASAVLAAEELRKFLARASASAIRAGY
ncbi:cation-translocating P-type ATPase [Caenimonas soli]|uniref:cation-translocating P-type ATPase n=1 Tax=Caenimonas soli TaxID=2735555 RepID=UPI001554E332|nr:HAD-IC family P-type ATPase [Caenimonas soli]NPC55899.1 HAD-IC family P-type ATPase [Caenimonas soli]